MTTNDMTILNQFGNPIRATDAGATPVQRNARYANPRTGAGGGADKSLGANFVDIRMEREFAERLYRMSWAARRLVRLVVDDMMARGRRWTGKDEGAIKAMQQAERELKGMPRLADAMIAGRLFGSAVMLAYPTVGDVSEPIKPADVPEGGIANLIVVDRYSLSIQTYHTFPEYPQYGEPYQYRWGARYYGLPDPTQPTARGTSAGSEVINAARTLRFDGLRSPATEGWTTGPWGREWGVSVLTDAVEDILRDASNNAAVGHLMQVASVWVNKIQNFKESLRGRPAPGEPSAEEIAQETNLLQSIYRMMFVDAEDEVERVSVVFAGIADLLNQQAERLATIAEVPKTRFLGQSATGLNATGEGDARDWRITVAAMQKRILDPILHDLDIMVSKHVGLAEPPEYEWIPLGDLTETEAAEVAKHQVEMTSIAYKDGVIDEDEYREKLSQIEFFGELGPWSGPNEMQQIEMDQQAEQAEQRMKEMAMRNGNGNGPPR